MDENARLEDLVTAFVARRETEPDLAPDAFAREHGGDAALLAAVRSAAEVLDALHGSADPGEAMPARIGNYAVVRELGRGGMGVVWEVERGGERFALKTLHAIAALGAHAQRRFEREARVLAELRHPGIVAVRDSGVADGVPFLVMELVEGRALDELGALDAREAAALVRDIARAIHTAHEAGIHHRDLKPANVRIRGDGTPVVLDFGLVGDDSDADLTRSGDLLGTPRYMAPEQASGGKTSARTDVYALGLLLCESIGGAPLRRASDRTAALDEARRGRLPRLRAALPALPAELERIALTALARDPARRFASAAALADDLQRWLDGQAVLARPPGFATRTAESLRDRPALGGALAVALLVAASAAAWAYGDARERAAAERAATHRDDALLAWLGGDLDASARACRVALAHDPDSIDVQFLLAIAEGAPFQGGAEPLARGLRDGLELERQQQWERSAAAFAAARDAAPSSALVRLLASRAERKAGRDAHAHRELVAAAQLLPDSAPLAAELARSWARRNDHAAALLEWERALALAPASPRLRYGLAAACYHVDPERGLAALRDARQAVASAAGDQVRLEPTPGAAAVDANSALLNFEAALLDRLGRTAEAIPLLERLAATDAQSSRYAFNLGYALDRQHRLAEAKRAYERALELDAANDHAALCLVWLLATAADPALQDAGRAEQLLVATLQRDLGRSERVLSMVREFALRTGRVAELARTLAALAESADPARRAALLHAQQHVLAGAPAVERRD